MEKSGSQSLEITKGNILFVASACFLLLLITFYKYGDEISISRFFGENKKVAGMQDISFEGLKAAHLADAEEISFEDLEEAVKLDPDKAGEVLGITSEDNLELPNIDEVLALDAVKQIPLKQVASNDVSKMEYVLALQFLEVEPAAQKAYSYLSLNDDQYKASQAERQQFMANLLAIPVPREKVFREYHQLKFLYYQTMFDMMDLVQGQEPDLWEQYTAAYLATLERIEKMRPEIDAAGGLQ